MLLFIHQQTQMIPLLNLNNLRRKFGFDKLYVKEESLNPTNSFKARGLSVAISKAWELGIKNVSLPSAGNAAGAMSAYAALSGMQANVFMPSNVPVPFISECKAYGAKTEEWG